MDFIVYLVCLGAGLVFTLISAIAGHLFGGHEGHVGGSGGHVEAGADMSDMPGVSAFSPTVLASFVMAFFASTSAIPCASKCTTLPLRATTVTAPEKSWPSIWP